MIEPKDVGLLFPDTGKPKPNIETLRFFAVTLANMSAHYRKKPSPRRTPQERAQKAVDQLRLDLPRIIAEQAEELAAKRMFQRSQARHARKMTEDKTVGYYVAHSAAERIKLLRAKMGENKRMLASLRDFDLPLVSRSNTSIWREDAENLFDMYQGLPGPPVGSSRQGPAAKFIQAALKLCGKDVTRGAIEAALSSRKQKTTAKNG